MPGAKRRIDPGVAQQLLAEPHRFEFFQAARLLEQVFQRQGVKAGQACPCGCGSAIRCRWVSRPPS